MKNTIYTCKKFLIDSLKISFTLFKIMIPVSIGVKILKELGAIEYFAILISPLMRMVGLPGSTGLVWATAMITNLYGAMVVFVSLIPTCPLTIAQVTLLTSMMLIAHSLPVELKIAREAGARMRAIGLIRIGGAFLFGILFNWILAWGKWLQQPNSLFWTISVNDTSLLRWALNELRNLLMIFVIILCLLILMKGLNRLGITDLLTKLLHPVLILLGIGKDATPITIIGMTLGMTYGGGLIIRGARTGTIHKKDIFFSLALLGLSHGLIEDTLLMMALGGHLSGLLWGRLLFSLIIVYLLVKILHRLSEDAFDRFFFIPRNDEQCDPEND